jgi:hypothetical protein
MINNREVEESLRELSAVTGEPPELSVSIAVRERLDRVSNAKNRKGAEAAINAHDSEYVRDLMLLSDGIGRKLRRDGRSLDELVGYDEGGLPA